MFKRILVPLDGSAHARQALAVALRVARASEGTLLLMHVVSLPATRPLPSTSPLIRDELLETAWAEGQSYLTMLAGSLRETGVTIQTEVVRGNPAREILGIAEAQAVDLIVMCRHGDTGLKRWVVGSVAHHVIHHSPVPVLLLQESQEEALVPEPARPLCALVALDGSPFAEAALLPAAHLVAALAGPVGGALHLTQVVQLPVGARREEVLHQLGPQGLASIQQYLVTIGKRVQDAAKDLKLLLHWSITLDTDIADALLRTAEEGSGDGTTETMAGCDLIALSTHGRGGFERWMMGSVTERVLNATRLPLLIVRPMSR